MRALLLLLCCQCAAPDTAAPTTPHSDDPCFWQPGAQDGELILDACWQIVADESLQDVAKTLSAGTLLMGCEDELPPMEWVTERGERPALELRVDEDLPPQGYRIRADHQSITISGGTPQGVRFGVTDWLQSLDRVQGETADYSPVQGQVCNDYDATCTDGELCWTDGWDPVDQVTWTIQDVDNAPTVDVRMVFASFKGTQNAHFLPTVVYADLGDCAQPDNLSGFWQGLQSCDRQGEGTCQEARRRLDGIVLGRFTHALDEGAPMSVGSAVVDETGCDGAVLYQGLERYLDARSVALVPTVFGLESRVAEGPVAGSRVHTDDPSEQWGLDGDMTLTEGLAASGTFTACAVDAGVALSPADCSLLDDGGKVVDSVQFGPTWDSDAALVQSPDSACEPGELCAVKETCWASVAGLYGDALQPVTSCTNPALRLRPPAHDGGLWALTFVASVPNGGDLRAKVIWRTDSGETLASDMPMLSTSVDEGEYLYPVDDPLGGTPWVRTSVVFRAPTADMPVRDAYVQLIAAPGSTVRVDEFALLSVDAQLARVDAASVFSPDTDCLRVIDGAQSPLASASFLDADGRPSGPLASVRADCLSPGDTVELQYRTWTHSGLWPGLGTRQLHWTWTPDPFAEGWWTDPTGVAAQIDALDTDPEWLLVSDLGGEARGVARSGEGFTPAGILSSLHCGIVDALGAADCSGLWQDGQVCACPDADPEPRLLVAADMYTPWHNGGDGLVPGKEGYQGPHGGPWGGSWTARRDMPSNTVYLAWWHFDTRKAGKPNSGMEHVLGIVQDFGTDGLDVIGASAWDPDMQQIWAAMAAGGWTQGVAHFGWGTDAQGPRVLDNAGRVFWQPQWALIDAWGQGDDALAPGGDDRAGRPSGWVLENTGMDWPRGTWWLRVDEPGTWSAPEPVAATDDVLVRLHGAFPEGCQVSVGLREWGQITPDAVDYRAWGVVLPAPTEPAVVQVQLADDCVGSVLDTVSVFERQPVVDFPRPWAVEGLDDWDSTEAVDARAKICGDPELADCVNAQSWGG